MKLKLKTSLAGNNFAFDQGEVLESVATKTAPHQISDEEAARLVARGYATEIREPQRK